MATAFKVPMQEALVKAGYMEPEEAGVVAGTPRVESLTNRELLAELARRLGEGEGDDVVMAMGSAAPFDPAALDREPPMPRPRH
ncbi:hypothetical protein [Rhodococcus sp. UNC363MFTsu5.1]|uniref:hypothetical protein n=1 Tax=Rhodococcus sp. UNC363MFTsu5.1 TaxID=1449069 RepID=UPI0012DD4637|nr:hypothetical protein [Rhodococcus sp. UNC363MFTsu5.1]